MKLLFVSRLERGVRAVSAITKYAEVGKRMGHEVAMFGKPRVDFPTMPHSVDIEAFDFAVFVIYETHDFPDLPQLAYLLDRMPKERRIIIDCTGTYNETIRVDHDCNHFVQLNGHESWEWIEGFQAVASKILQPTLKPLREDVRSFLFFGYDPSAEARSYRSPQEAAAAWSSPNGAGKPYGVIYVGHNWERWSQLRRFFEALEPVKRRVGVETGGPMAFDEVIALQGQARFCPIFHRPLFNQLGLVTNRTFETFCSDTLPLLMLPEGVVEGVHGPDALRLRPGDDVLGRLEDMMRRPEFYWDAVLRTRAHLAAHHSYERRFEELMAILED